MFGEFVFSKIKNMIRKETVVQNSEPFKSAIRKFCKTETWVEAVMPRPLSDITWERTPDNKKLTLSSKEQNVSRNVYQSNTFLSCRYFITPSFSILYPLYGY